jgi:hypothetical protein
LRLPDNGRACHPKIRASSVRHYTLDEPGHATPPACSVTGTELAPIEATLPAVVRGCTPRARRCFASLGDALAETVADPALNEAVRGDCTIGVLFRVHTAPLGESTLWALSGHANDTAGDDENYLASLIVLGTGKLRLAHEHGDPGTNVVVNFAEATIRPFMWTYAVIRRSGVTGPGPAGTVDIDLIINGAGTDSAPGTVNASDGGDSLLRLNHELAGSGDPASVGNVDLGGFYVWSEALTDAEIADDARRIRQLAFYARADLAVRLTDLDGATHELTNLDGVDFVSTVEISNELDQPTVTADITLLREQEALSLASLRTDTKLNLSDPLDLTSYRPLILEGAAIEILAARVPLGIRARAGELESLFSGHIDDIDEGGERTQLHCRDLGGRLIDTFIEEEVDYGDAAGLVDVEVEMQKLLDDNDNDTGNDSVAGLVARNGAYDPVTLYVPDSPGWAITEWRQRREPVLSALRALAGQVAWECRYQWVQDPFAPGWRLSFYEPDRARIDVDCVLTADDILDVRQLSRSLLGMRNVVRVIYPSAETVQPSIPALPAGIVGRQGWHSVDGEGQRLNAYVELESTTSIDVCGRRLFMEVVEEGASQVSTISEAFAFALGMLLDLSGLNVAKSVEVPLTPEMELNDVVRFESSPLLFTAPQTLAVRKIGHSFSERATTTVELRGKPAVGFKRWLRLEARPGQGRPGVTDPRDALTDTRLGHLVQFFRNVFDRSSLLTGGKFVQVKNSDFSSFASGLGSPPDGWNLGGSAVWGTDVDVDVATHLSGGKAVRFTSAAGELVSDPIAVAGDPTVPYSVEVKWQRVGAGSYVPLVEVEWLDADRVPLVTTTTLQPGAGFVRMPNFDAVSTAADVWFQSRADGVTPDPDVSALVSSARFVRLRVRPQSGGTFTPIIVDDVAFYRTARELVSYAEVISYNTPVGSTSSWHAIRFGTPTVPSNDPAQYDLGKQCFQSGSTPFAATTIPSTGEALGTGFGSGFYAREDMTVLVTATVTIESATGAGTTTALRLVKNATYDSNHENSGGTVLAGSQQSTLVASANLGNAAITANAAAIMTLSNRVRLKRGDRLTVEFYRNINDSIAAADSSGTLTNIAIKQDIAQ